MGIRLGFVLHEWVFKFRDRTFGDDNLLFMVGDRTGIRRGDELPWAFRFLTTARKHRQG